MSAPAFDTLRQFPTGDGGSGWYHSLPELERQGAGAISRLPVSLRVVLESVLRNCDGRRVRREDVLALAGWRAGSPAPVEIPFVVARIVLQDFTGVPLLVDLAAMRDAVARLGRDPAAVEPLVPVDLVVDHSVQVDHFGVPDAMRLNLEAEFRRNRERYEFLKWGQGAFRTFRVIPPGIGIVHQVNLEYLARGVLSGRDGEREIYYPDTLVGTDSHTTMINGLGIVGWGVGGIEAEAGMLGQPVYFLTPQVVGVHMSGELREGVTATDLALHVTQMLRAARVVGKFVEFHGEGAARLTLPDRATIANMAPEYGATMGYFPADEESVAYLRATGRDAALCATFEGYLRAQGMFGIPRRGEVDYSAVLELDLGEIEPSVAGPRRPQDRVALGALGRTFADLLERPVAEGGYGKAGEGAGSGARVQVASRGGAGGATLGCELRHGSVLIAAITSCTNTSNPSVMLAAGLLAKRAVERGLEVAPAVKTSLAPGSRVVTDYLGATGLQPYLDRLGFHVVGYGCTTCIGNSGPLDPGIERALQEADLVAASVLSGNRNFEARVHQSIRANFLMSPPLVVAFALAGRVDIDMTREPIGRGSDGAEVYLRDLWPTASEIGECMRAALSPDVFRRLYRDFEAQNPQWNAIPSKAGTVYAWDAASDYIQAPPFFERFEPGVPGAPAPVAGARALAILGDSVTTDHISPAGAIRAGSPAGRYLLSRGVAEADFNSYGSRRGNDRVMTRGTFANVRIRNQMVPGVEGGVTVHRPSGEQMTIFDAAMRYREEGVPLVIFAGEEYGTGSSRDWAAKGTRLLGVRAVIARSYERIHRSNLVGMGILPLQFAEGQSAAACGIDGSETFDLLGLEGGIRPGCAVTLRVGRAGGGASEIPLALRIDTPIEVEYYRHGGILPYVLRQILGG